MNDNIKLTLADGRGTIYLDPDWILGAHQYDGRTLVVAHHDMTLWVEEPAGQISYAVNLLREISAS